MTPRKLLPETDHKAATPTPSESIEPLRIDSRLLLRGRRTVEIEHAGQRYTLRATRENKLILTKQACIAGKKEKCDATD